MTDYLANILRDMRTPWAIEVAERLDDLEKSLSTAVDVQLKLMGRLTAAEASRDQLAARLKRIHDRAMDACSEWHASTKNAQARQAYALALHDIATIANEATEKKP